MSIQGFKTGLGNQQRSSIGGGKKDMKSRPFVILEVLNIVPNKGGNNGYVEATCPFSQNPEKVSRFRVNNNTYMAAREKQRTAGQGAPRFLPTEIDEKFKHYLFTEKQEVAQKIPNHRIFLLAENVVFERKEGKVDVFNVGYFSNLSMREDRNFHGVFSATGFYDKDSDRFNMTEVGMVQSAHYVEGNPYYCDASGAKEVKSFAELLDAAKAQDKEYKDRYGFILRVVGKLAEPVLSTKNPNFKQTHVCLYDSGAYTPYKLAKAMHEQELAAGNQSHELDTSILLSGEYFLSEYERFLEYVKTVGKQLAESAEQEGQRVISMKVEFIPFRIFKPGEHRMFKIPSSVRPPIRRLFDTYSGLYPAEKENMEVTVGHNMAITGFMAMTDDAIENKYGQNKVRITELANGLYTSNGFVGSIHDLVAANGAPFGETCRLLDSLRIPDEEQSRFRPDVEQEESNEGQYHNYAGNGQPPLVDRRGAVNTQQSRHQPQPQPDDLDDIPY